VTQILNFWQKKRGLKVLWLVGHSQNEGGRVREGMGKRVFGFGKKGRGGDERKGSHVFLQETGCELLLNCS